MYVKDHMTKNPVTVGADTVLSKALDLMRHNNFHRLPVVDGEGKLIGLVTGGLVEESSGAKNTSLSIYELNYLLSRTKVSDIMIRDVKTTTADVLVEEAAQKMLDNNIAVLPVVDGENHVQGIITDKDIFLIIRFITDVGHVTDQLIQQVIRRDHSGKASVFVQYDGKVTLGSLQVIQQAQGRFAFRDKEGRLCNFLQIQFLVPDKHIQQSFR